MDLSQISPAASSNHDLTLAREVQQPMTARLCCWAVISALAGFLFVAALLYISEIVPAAHRGRLAGMFQFNIVFGIVVAFVSNRLLSGIGENAWRWMLGIAVLPSLIYTGLCLVLPESPRWLLTRRNDVRAGCGCSA